MVTHTDKKNLKEGENNQVFFTLGFKKTVNDFKINLGRYFGYLKNTAFVTFGRKFGGNMCKRRITLQVYIKHQKVN